MNRRRFLLTGAAVIAAPMIPVPAVAAEASVPVLLSGSFFLTLTDGTLVLCDLKDVLAGRFDFCDGRLSLPSPHRRLTG